MTSPTVQGQSWTATDEADVRALHGRLLLAWNECDAGAMADLFIEDGSSIGFDGSMYSGRDEIAAEIGKVFADHETSMYVGKVKDVRFLSPDVAIVGAVVGMIPPGVSDLNPAVNTIQSFTAVKVNGVWRVALYQTTPAQFHGRPDLAEKLTAELRELL